MGDVSQGHLAPNSHLDRANEGQPTGCHVGLTDYCLFLSVFNVRSRDVTKTFVLSNILWHPRLVISNDKGLKQAKTQISGYFLRYLETSGYLDKF